MNAFAPLVAAIALAQSAPQAPAETQAPPTSSPSPPAQAGGEGRGEGASDANVPATRPSFRERSATPKPGSTSAGATRSTPSADRDEAERAARAFLDALAAGDADGLVRASSERFSFDGQPQSGRDAIRGTWRAILSGRDGPRPQVGRVEILAAAEAIARLGPPPARIAPLARPGVLVAVADVGGRPVVLFLAREGGRMAVFGMHD
jgi:hypothetical protein